MKFTPWPPCTTVYQCTKFHYFSTYSSMGSHGLQWLNKKRGLGLNKKGYKFNAWPPINNLNTFNVFPPQSHPSTVSSCSVREVGSSLSSQGFWSGLKDAVVSGSGPGPPFGGACLIWYGYWNVLMPNDCYSWCNCLLQQRHVDSASNCRWENL